ncbi:MAG: sodium/proline symporter [Gammaproteobacteria bacterium]|nr:sodium/proline symporter [Gammaproteobacteria bacterium]
MTLTFVITLLLFVAVGLAASRQARHHRQDYYLAGRSVPPWLVALSAVATNNSGYMFIGVIGYTLYAGFAAIWLMAGWICGDFIASLHVHRRLRAAAARTGEVTYGGLLANWYGRPYSHLRRITALVTLLFLGSYAAAQLLAGSKALHVLLGWPLAAGAVVAAAVVLAYSLAGGIRASIWTDAVQSLVMITTMGGLLWVAVVSLGGPLAAFEQLQAVPGYTDPLPPELALPGLAGLLLFVAGWMVAGFAVVGQPHIMVRFMALNNGQRMTTVRLWYYSWFILFYLAATAVGLLSRLILGAELADPELALPTMALQLLPEPLVGLLLAGIFAATLSTADSLLLACSAAVTQDLPRQRLERPLWLKVATLGVTLLALTIALSGSDSVFTLVILSWGVLGSAFAPLLLVYCAGGQPSERRAIAMLLVGVGVALLWRYLGWHQALFEGLPAAIVSLALYRWWPPAIGGGVVDSSTSD